MFFSVKTPMKIAGKVYLPCICYPLSRFLEHTVDYLVKKDKAVKYDEMVFFQNGKVLPTQKELKAKEKEEKKTKKEAEKKAKNIEVEKGFNGDLR